MRVPFINESDSSQMILSWEAEKSKLTLIQKLQELHLQDDIEIAHIRADEALLDFINDKEIADAFDKIKKWYA